MVITDGFYRMLGFRGDFLPVQIFIRRAPGQHSEDLDFSQAILPMKPVPTHFLSLSLIFSNGNKDSGTSDLSAKTVKGGSIVICDTRVFINCSGLNTSKAYFIVLMNLNSEKLKVHIHTIGGKS